MLYTFVRTTCVFTIVITLVTLARAHRGEFIPQEAVWIIPMLAGIFAMGWTAYTVLDKEDVK